MENRTHRGEYTGTANMNAENQDMAFVNDTLENAKNKQPINIQKDDLNENAEDKRQLEQ